jgi:hypothetical protein
MTRLRLCGNVERMTRRMLLSSLATTSLVLAAFSIRLVPAYAQSRNPFAGRWDIVVTAGDQTYPDWLELVEKDGAVQARVQPKSGNVRPVTVIKLEGDHLTLRISAANKKNPETTWELTASGGKISGTEKHGDQAAAQLAGVRAPELKRDPPKAWSTAEPLFDGKDLKGWEPDDPSKNHWVAQNGELVNLEHGANLRTTRKFEDFKLHFELNCPDGGNSGFYLRGRYEIQVAYEKGPGPSLSMGAIYGMIAPSVEMPRKPGEWESVDATLVGRTVTVVRDGTTVIDHQEIPGITGGALDANEAEPGPFYIQGDHTGGMKYRNITIAVAKR